MESITKNRQSTAVLKAMIERAYGADQVPDGEDFAAELGHGWFNVAYRLRLRDGRQAVLKIAPPADVTVMTYEQRMMRNEWAAIGLVTDETSVPVPRIDFADGSGELCDADWFVMPFIDAANLGILQEEGAVGAGEYALLTERLGALNRELNGIVGPGFGPLLSPTATSWREAFTGILEDVLQDGERAGVDLGWGYDEVRAAIAEHAPALEAVTEPRFVEWDLWPGNVMVREGEIVAIIDHERALYGDPLMEAGFVGTDLPGWGDSDAFMRGYGAAPLTDAERTRRHLYTLHLVLVMIIETSYRGHEDPGQYDMARAALVQVMALLGRTR